MPDHQRWHGQVDTSVLRPDDHEATIKLSRLMTEMETCRYSLKPSFSKGFNGVITNLNIVGIRPSMVGLERTSTRF